MHCHSQPAARCRTCSCRHAFDPTYHLSKWIYETKVVQKSESECVSAVDPDLFTIVKRMCSMSESSWTGVMQLWNGFKGDDDIRDLSFGQGQGRPPQPASSRLLRTDCRSSESIKITHSETR